MIKYKEGEIYSNLLLENTSSSKINKSVLLAWNDEFLYILEQQFEIDMSIRLLFRNWKRFHVHVTQHARYSLLTFFVKNSLNGLIRIKSMMICNGEEWKKREILQFTVVYKKWKCLDNNVQVETYNDAWWAYAKICDASSDWDILQCT